MNTLEKISKKELIAMLIGVIVLGSIPWLDYSFTIKPKEKAFFQNKKEATHLSQLTCKDTCEINTSLKSLDSLRVDKGEVNYYYSYEFSYLGKTYLNRPGKIGDTLT